MQKEADNQLSLFNRHSTNYQSNVFTLSRQEYTELEKKIVILVVNQLGNLAVQGKLQPGVNMVFSLPYSELTKDHHSQITAAAEGLSKKRISYKDEQQGEFVFVTPFPFVKSQLINNRRYIEIKVLADVVPHFAALGQRYTKYDLDVIWSLSSIYAMRMFEIMSMHQHIKKTRFTFSVDELRYILNCPDTYRYNDFQKYVLEVTQRELKQKANILLEWKPSLKIGKRVVELEFEIKTEHLLASEGVKEDALRLSTMSPNELVIKGYEVMAHYQLKPWQKDAVVTDMQLLETLFRVHSEFVNGLRPEVKNRNRYLAKSLSLDKLRAPKATKAANTLPIGPQLNFIQSTSNVRAAGAVKSIGSLIGGMIPSNESK
ncbi:replication initiation protein [Spirosoma flavum]|uniref:Replication initiation protein n=1 Tax=Spirosoma flavum TaxID=2048557 RepID=A0ABW6ATD0_9BACT